MKGSRCYRAKGRGFYVASVLLVILAFIATWMMGFITLSTQNANNALAGKQTDYLSHAKDALTLWYAENVSTVETNSGPLDVNAILQQIGITPTYGLVATSSNQLTQGGIPYHVLALWMPGSAPGTPSINVTTGQVTAGTNDKVMLVNGLNVQMQALKETQRRMRKMAMALENYFQSNYLLDMDRRMDINHFRATNCTSPDNGQLPCVDTYTNTTSTPIPVLTGIDASTATDAWGNPIKISNLADSHTAAPPYSMALQTTTPWGQVVSVFATQPM